jgi:tetratricopeptide (TPR) repeat protein
MALSALRARVAELRAQSGVDAAVLATALIDLAEAEPILGHRQAVVRGLLDEAAILVDSLASAALEGRIFLRLAYVKLTEGDLEAVEQLVSRAGDRLAADAADDADRATEALALLARVTVRRHSFDQAVAQLTEASDTLDRAPTTLVQRRVTLQLALAWVELAIEQKAWRTAGERLNVVAIAETDVDLADDAIDVDFARRQAQTLLALMADDYPRGAGMLREVVAIAKRAGSVADELEGRIALAGALTRCGDQISLDEAAKHLQVARDAALEHGLDAFHMAALVGQAGLLAQTGKTQAALDRCIEIARSAVEKRDLPRYGGAVALMAQLYEQRGDLATAYRTFAEAHAVLKEQIGDTATDLIRPHLAAFAERIGQDKFREIAELVNKAANARLAFRRS